MNHDFAEEALDAAEKMSRWQKFEMSVFGRKIYIGHEQRDGWSGKLPFFLFWCQTCQHFAKGYPNGQPSDRYLICSNCNAEYDFTTIKGLIEDWRRRHKTYYEVDEHIIK